MHWVVAVNGLFKDYVFYDDVLTKFNLILIFNTTKEFYDYFSLELKINDRFR